MVDATAEAAPGLGDGPAGAAYQFDDDTKTMTVAFSDLYIVSTDGVEVFALNLNEWDGPPPFYLNIDGREFAMQPSNTYLVTGHGAALPAWVEAEESAGRLTVLVERDLRYLVYSHDTLAVDEEEEDEAAATDDESAE